jgi:alpha-ketoglutarate-dependent taurine dioxygenase
MPLDVLDCTNECTPSIPTVTTNKAWVASDLTSADWLVPLDGSCTAEIRSLARYIEANPLGSLQRRPEELPLRACESAVKRLKAILDDGVGFAVLDRMPIEEFKLATLVEIYWVLGQLLAPPVAQKWNGEMIYEVRDTGKKYGYGVRGSHTNVELVFHTDNAFGRMVPDYVGLFCKNTALEGGISRFCSLYTVHDRMQEQHPELLKRLYQPMLFDRQAEHAEGEPKVTLAPFFSWRGDKLFARANTSLVRKGYLVVDQDMDTQLSSALNALDQICTSEDLWYEAALAPGHIQYLNNHELGHYRSEFIDHEDDDKKRHLFRLWHRNEGSASYDGVMFSA